MSALFQSKAAILSVLVLLALIGIFVPRMSFGPNTSPIPSDPAVEKIRDEYTLVEPWLKQDQDAQALVADLLNQQNQIQDKKLEQFNSATTAEQALASWMSQHHPRSLEAIEQDPTGKTSLDVLRKVYLIKEKTRLQAQNIDSALNAVHEIRRDIRRRLVDRTKNSEPTGPVQKRLADLRKSTSETSSDSLNAATLKANKAAQDTVQRILNKD